jgi:hypothetical protein
VDTSTARRRHLSQQKEVLAGEKQKPSDGLEPSTPSLPVGNELAAQIRQRAGSRLGSAAMTADGNHARVDGFVSLGVVGSAIVAVLARTSPTRSLGSSSLW